MATNKNVVVVFTARSPERIVREGGSQAWRLDAVRANRCEWLVCAQNRHHKDREFSDATEPHGQFFLVGKISKIRDADLVKYQGRYMIEMSEFAQVSIPGGWAGWRNPVRYTTLSELGIDPENLEFTPLERRLSALPLERAAALSIAEAKAGLAVTFGVRPESVDITIRG